MTSAVIRLDRHEAAEPSPEHEHRREAQHAADGARSRRRAIARRRRRTSARRGGRRARADRRAPSPRTVKAAITQRFERSSRTPDPIWPLVNRAATPSASVTTSAATRGEWEKKRAGPPSPAIANAEKEREADRREQGETERDHAPKTYARAPAAAKRSTVKTRSPSRPLARSASRDRIARAATTTEGPHALRHRNRARRQAQADRRDRRRARHSRGRAASLRPRHRQDRAGFLPARGGRAPDGKLILVTAISPTPAGEGKTTTTVGLGDALNRIGKQRDRSACASPRSARASA